MTPKAKAKGILKKVGPHSKYWDCYNDEPLEENHALKIALICVDEILSLFEQNKYDSRYDYYQAVKAELEKL